jgi:hypothetical protein
VKSLNNVIEGCLTDGTQGVTVFAQLLAAIFVEEVTTFGDIARRPRRVKVFHAHRTIGPGRVFHTLQTINDWLDLSVKIFTLWLSISRRERHVLHFLQ